MTAPVEHHRTTRAAVPAVYLESPLIVDICAALDTMLTGQWAALDTLPALFDPAASAGPWLAHVAGARTLPDFTPDQRRKAITEAFAIAAARGTEAGLQREAKEVYGWTVTSKVTEGTLVVTLTDPAVAEADKPKQHERLWALASAHRPAHLRLQVVP
ncbi:phage tail protein [Kitasatospora sp. NPDC058048]|uniref:phage tail protein n=1 Tax=Kitasatospora sp. NPDC058048 TaxID=3346313 RepID=UPI0036DB59FE